MTMMLEARDLYCERDERTLFRGLSFTVEAGEWVQVTGGNGAGKTTLLRLLTGLARPDGGEVYWQGEPLRRVRDSFHRSLLWIKHQLEEDKMGEQLSIPYPGSLFTGRK
ncbi:cytochrome c biogenesis protein CcmA [Salmonella enterica subsp. enterica serovar Typhi]|nr:cytochrome c biogenesis protein CcmA [Salmonella enterica subsp. enterica serovar Typhi]